MNIPKDPLTLPSTSKILTTGVNKPRPPLTEEEEKKLRKIRRKALIIRYVKILFLLICWLIFASCLMIYEERKSPYRMLCIPPNGSAVYNITNPKEWGVNVLLRLSGIFRQISLKFGSRTSIKSSGNDSYLEVTLQEISEDGAISDISKPWRVYIQNVPVKSEKITIVERVFQGSAERRKYRFLFRTNQMKIFPFQLSVEFSRITQIIGVMVAIVLITLIFIYLVLDLIHRTMAGIICCTLGIGLLAAMRMRQELLVIIGWIPIDTLMHYFGMSIVMAVLSETGLQDFLAATSYQLANGHIWPLLNTLLICSLLLSIIFNDITIALFITPVCLRVCEIMTLNHVPVLICLMIALNIGQAISPLSATTNGDIRNHPTLGKNKISVGAFLLHMIIPVSLAAIQSYIHMRIKYSNSARMRLLKAENDNFQEQYNMLRQAAETSKTSANSKPATQNKMSGFMNTFRERIRRFGKMPKPPENYEEKMKSISHHFRVKNKLFLVAGLTSVMVLLVLTLFTMIPKITYLSDGWAAMVAAMLALTILDLDELDMILSRIDWGTMIFIATQFILMEVLILLGFLESIGFCIEGLLYQVNEDYVLIVGILIILSISALLTTLMDNAPVANMMMKVIAIITQGRKSKNLPSGPLIWALALGCNLGANGSLIASYANISCSGVASSHGHPISFLVFLITAFPVMIGNIVVVAIYLLIAHVLCGWV